MNELFSLFLENLLPIFLAAGAGYLLSKFTSLSPRTFSRVTFYIFSPCLIFSLLTQSELSNGAILRVVLFAWTITVIVGILTWIAGRAVKLERRRLAGVLLTSMFMNAGNYGMAVVLFAFGTTALGYASVYFVSSAILAYTLGVVIASMGSASLLKAITNLLKIPTVYAVILALIFMQTRWQVPIPLERTVNLLGDAAIPAMLILLGMQFTAASWSNKTLPMLIAGSMRMLVSPFLALLLGPLFGMIDAARQATTMEAAMPSAVLTTVLATEFDVDPPFVTAVVFATTLFSPLTLTPLLAYLGA